jgi:hypothetical protein
MTRLLIVERLLAEDPSSVGDVNLVVSAGTRS